MDIDMETGTPTLDGFMPPQNDPMSLIMQFRRLDIGGGSPEQMSNNPAQIDAGTRKYTRPLTKPVHLHFEIPSQPLAQPLNWPAESTGGPDDDLGEMELDVDESDEWVESPAMRSAMHKKGKERTRTARKRLSKGPMRRNKIGGVGRHRHNTSRASLPNRPPAPSQDGHRNRSSSRAWRAKKGPVGRHTGRSTSGPGCLVNSMASLSMEMDMQD